MANPKTHSRRPTRPTAVGLALAMTLWLPSIAAAQTQSTAPLQSISKGDPSVCTVQESDVATSASATHHPLLLSCNGMGTLLGEADQFDVFVNKDLRAVLIDIRRNGRRRILLASVRTSGPPLVEDISGQLAMKAGKGPVSPIDDVEVDLTGFARNGTVDVGGGVAPEPSVDLVQQVGEVRSAPAAVTTQGQAAGQ